MKSITDQINAARGAANDPYHEGGSATFLPAAAVRARYGNCSDTTIWRWTRDPRMSFPKPIYANSRHRLWKLGDLEAWEQSRTIEGGSE